MCFPSRGAPPKPIRGTYPPTEIHKIRFLFPQLRTSGREGRMAKGSGAGLEECLPKKVGQPPSREKK